MSAAVQAAQVSGLQLLLLDHKDGRVDWAIGTEHSERPSSRHGSSVMPFTAVWQAFGRRREQPCRQLRSSRRGSPATAPSQLTYRLPLQALWSAVQLTVSCWRRARRELRISDFWITRCQSMCSSTAAHGSRSIPEAESITNTNYSRVVTNPRLQSERQWCHENSGPK